MPTLLQHLATQFGLQVDADSSGGQILNSLTLQVNFDPHHLDGDATLSALTLVPTTAGIAVRAAAAGDSLVFSLPSKSFHFLIKPGTAGSPLQVEITLIDIEVPVPFLHAANLTPQGVLVEAGGGVKLQFPSILLVVTAVAAPQAASAKLAPSQTAGGALQVTMVPPYALLGAGAVLGLHFASAELKADGPEPELRIPSLDIFVNPEGISAVAVKASATGFVIGLGATNGGITGEFNATTLPGAGAAARPRFLRDISLHLSLRRSSVTLLKLSGSIDVTGEAQTRLGGALDDGPSAIAYVLSLALDSGWRAELALSGSGADFLWRTQGTGGQGDIVRNTLGAYAVFSPLLGSAVPDQTSGYTALGLAAGVAGGLAAGGVVRTRTVTLYGGDLIVNHPTNGTPAAFLFFDLQTEIDIVSPILETARPVKVRHKAIGLRLDFGTNGASPQLNPVFDPQQGFTLDLSDPGAFKVKPDALADILQPDAARMSRDNPLLFEVDLVVKADLGVVTIDRASVRIPIDPPGAPSLTGLGAHLDAGAIKGDGYLKIDSLGFAGELDAALTSLGVRVGAALLVQKLPNNGPTAVLAKFDIEWPVPLPLFTSGLGLFGILGLFGMHTERNQAPNQDALGWLSSVGGDPTSLTGWRAALDHWAFGVGAVVGTLEGGFLVHAKGMLIVELPGPRLLLMMNADILSKRPDKRGNDTGTLLAVIEVSPDKLSIGVVVDYSIPILLEIHIPAAASFTPSDLPNWTFDLGGIPDTQVPAKVKFLSAFKAEGYLEFHGRDIPLFPALPGGLKGLAVAAGVRASFTWGPEDIGLYIKVGARADVGLSFKPLMIVGQVTVDGELHLFIVGIGVSATGAVKISADDFYLKLVVCGEVDLFFDTLEACVTLELGNDQIKLPDPDPMIRALSLHSRTTAYLPGSGAGRPIDGSFGDAFHLDDHNNFVGQPGAAMPVVPIDAIPVLQFEMRPVVPDNFHFLSGAGTISSPLASTDWVRRGQRFCRYQVKAIRLDGTDGNGAALSSPTTAGDTPAAWWNQSDAKASEDGDVQLALFNWIPDPVPAAAERTNDRDTYIDRRWGTVCTPVAEPAPVLWSFNHSARGPSAPGWALLGDPYPDPPGRQRSAPPYRLLRVTEPWRSGNALADSLVAVDPAFVRGSPSRSEHVLVAPHTGAAIAPRIEDTPIKSLLQQLGLRGGRTSIDALRLDSNGMRRIRVLFFAGRAPVLIGQLFVLRAFDASGSALGAATPLAPIVKAIGNVNQLPPEWSAASSPWLATVSGTTAAFQTLPAGDGTPALFFFELKLPAGCHHVEISVTKAIDTQPARWGLLLVEALTEAEFTRYSVDQTNQKTTISEIEGALGTDPESCALLIPGATYTLGIDYEVTTTDPDAQGNPASPAVGPVAHSQQFRFRTDAQPPQRLDPWVMMTDPAAGQEFVFCGDPITVVFSTTSTRKLYDAYGRGLFAVVYAASGKHPAGGSGAPGGPFTVGLNTLGMAQGIKSVVMSPFEMGLRAAVADAPCVDATQTSSLHDKITIPVPLDPLTNYVLDVEARPIAATDQTPLFRRHFGTSRYTNAKAMADAVRTAKLRHRWLDSAAPLTALTGVVSDIAFETALRDARWGDLARPATPRVTVIWAGPASGPAEQPAALLIETPEPLWRERQVPTLVQDGLVQRFELKPAAWLDVAEVVAGTARVAKLVRSTDGARTLAVLATGSRGATVALSLRRQHDLLIEGDKTLETNMLLSAVLVPPPWEAAP